MKNTPLAVSLPSIGLPVDRSADGDGEVGADVLDLADLRAKFKADAETIHAREVRGR